jgi:ureidoglycolate lyase
VAKLSLTAEPLTAQGFERFGHVIETDGHRPRLINEGTAERFHDLALVDVAEGGGRPVISIFKARPRHMPFQVKVLERHPLSSQAFYPLDGLPYLVVVAEEGQAPLASRIRAFRALGNQGVSYRRNTWHHALLALERVSHFLVVDRDGQDENCEELPVEPPIMVVASL